MSPPFFRNLMIFAGLLMFGLSSVATAQSGLKRDGYKFLEAVRDRDGNVVEAMLDDPETGILVNTRDLTSGQTAMHIVAERRDTLWITYLAENGGNPNATDKNGLTPLMISTRLGHAEGVAALLAAGARIDPATSTGETPLIMAVHGRDVPMVRVLLANGANPDRTDGSGRSARDYVAEMNDRRMTEAFAEADKARGDSQAEQYGPSL